MKKRIISIILCSLIAGGAMLNMSACGEKKAVGGDENSQPDSYSAESVDTPDTYDKADNDNGQSAVLTDELKSEISCRITDFSAVTFSRIFSTDENTLVSPLSVYTLMSLVTNGAQGNTRLQLTDTLSGYYQYSDAVVCYGDYNPLSADDLNVYFANYMSCLNNDNKESAKLSMANSVWMRDSDKLEFKPDFLSISENYYNAQLFKSKFDSSAVRDINGWVKKNTDGMIDKIIDDIPTNAIAYLINALAFDAEWTEPYTNENVQNGEFTNYDGSISDVKMMYSQESEYIDDGTATGFIKDYKGGRYCFAALLPNERIDIADYIENNLTGESITSCISDARGAVVHASMPKFEQEYSASINDVLTGIGIIDAFDSGAADFSSLADTYGENIYLSDVIHKTYIAVDEKGTRAGAVTAGVMETNGMADPKVEYVCLDRPFVYMIYDKEEQIPVFIGALLDVY